MEDLTGIGKIVDSELVKQAYEDAAQPAAKEVGQLGEDSLKALRLFTAPIQLLATAQDRFARWLNEVRDSVPPERQVEARSEIAGPILLNLRFLDDDSEIRHMFLNLLRLEVDSAKRGLVHPGFVKVIEQLAPHDAKLLILINEHGQCYGEKHGGEYRQAEMLRAELPGTAHWAIETIQASIDLLRGFSLINLQEGLGAQFGTEVGVTISLSTFGRQFVDAVEPQNEG